MIDIKEYRNNPEKYIIGAKNKGVDIDRNEFNRLDEQLREEKTTLDALLKERNDASDQVQQLQKAGEDFSSIVTKVKSLKEKIASQQDKVNTLQDLFHQMLLRIPNPSFDEVPVGAGDHENIVLETVGTIPTFDFTPRPHREILEEKGYLDQERAVKLSGARFQIVRGKFAQLELAMISRVVAKLTAKGFELALIPQLVQERALEVTGFLPNDATNLYRVNPKSTTPQNDREEDDLWLIGTAEVGLVGQHTDETFSSDQLPKRYVGFSSCYRREAGTYGKDTKGLIRLHQFEKVEMVSFVDPSESAQEHELLREIEEEIFTDLGIPFNRIDICTGDLGAPAAKKYDLEARFPGIGSFKEVTSTSNTTDFQTRRGNIKVQQGTEKVFAHSLNGTAVALGRALAALVENYQTKEGDILIPKVLQPYMSCDRI